MVGVGVGGIGVGVAVGRGVGVAVGIGVGVEVGVGVVMGSGLTSRTDCGWLIKEFANDPTERIDANAIAVKLSSIGVSYHIRSKFF